MPSKNLLFTDSFVDRHVGPGEKDVTEMLRVLGAGSLNELIDRTVPAGIRMKNELSLDSAGVPSYGRTEHEAMAELREMAGENVLNRSYLGMGYHETLTPPVIQRNILENPGWYTQYTPYQAEISQGRLEALLNFQTLVTDLTGLEISNASLLDEATAAAEAMAMCFAIRGRDTARPFFAAEDCHPQTLAVVKTRAEALGIEVVAFDPRKADFARKPFGILVQYPSTDGGIHDYRDLIAEAHRADALVVMAADILALTVLRSPGELGADIAVGSAQRFGVPMGYGGPHAAFLATRDEHKRLMPGRIVGVSKDAEGKPGIRLALQTREQHIRRDKATSNICTAQVLLAVMASMYAVYHGPQGLRAIAERVNLAAAALAAGLRRLGYSLGSQPYFDTLKIETGEAKQARVLDAARAAGVNLRVMGAKHVSVALDEAVTERDIDVLLKIFAEGRDPGFKARDAVTEAAGAASPYAAHERKSAYLSHPVFNRYHSETEMLRYIKRLEAKDLSLTSSMIPLGSCTMKLNAAAEMLPITLPGFSRLHPFVPLEQARGYQRLIRGLERMLSEITGFPAVSLQPNAGSQGEYAGLLVIREYHAARGEPHRDVCLIPASAHGTNPASAALAGMKVVPVRTDESGNVDLKDLEARAAEHARNLAALMITYPSTHGVFEESVREVCAAVHKHGGQVYMDGANMNAQVGICRPADFGADVCHLNLHKTFCIPHGGGGPGMGPIGVKDHLAPFLPGHPVVATGGAKGVGAVSAAPWGSASILPISYAYIAMMGSKGLRRATEVAILNANYIARRLEKHYPVLYKGREGYVAHECILDLRPLKATSGVEVEDVAKRLMDYGFHAPTISFPVPGTVMIEPTESESKGELDRFCQAMISIREEIAEIESGKADKKDNLLKNAPHTASQATRTEWTRPYSRERAVFPAPWVRESKFWPSVARIDSVYGERNLVCACPPMEAYAEG